MNSDAIKNPAPPAGERQGAPSQRSLLRSVALPTEHGGWGLTGEPIVLGLAVSPSWAGLCLGLATMLAFLARTPLRLVLVDLRRQRSLPRTVLARKVLTIEALAATVLLGVAVLVAHEPFWWPLAIAGPLVAVELWFDSRSRSRRVLPELAGTVGVSASAAMIILAGAGSASVAVAAWLVLAARGLTSIPHIRAQVERRHGRDSAMGVIIGADIAALAFAIGATLIEPSAWPGSTTAVILIAYLWASANSTASATALGIRQTIIGLAVVIATAVGLNHS